jgi:hypothetical protein
MDFEKLFKLVHDLEPSQRRNFTLYLKKKKDTLPIELYRRILRFNAPSPTNQVKIKKGKFEHPRTYYNNRVALAKLIIKSLVYYEHASIPVIPYVKRAFLVDANEIALAALFSEMRRLQKLENFSAIIGLYGLIDDVESSLALDIEVPGDIFSYERILCSYTERRKLNGFIKRIRKASKCEIIIRKQTATEILNEMFAPFLSRENQDLAAKIRMNSAFLEGNYQDAYKHGQALIESIKQWPDKYSPVFIARELRFMAFNSIHLNNRTNAIRYAMELSMIKTSNSFEENQVRISSIMVGSTVAACFAEESIATKVFQDIKDFEGLFSKSILAKTYFSIGTSFFYNENYSEAKKAFQASWNSLSTDDAFLRWEPQTLIAICNHELSDTDGADSEIRAASRFASQEQTCLPTLLVGIVRNYLRSDEFDPNAGLGLIEGIMAEPEEKRAGHYFSGEIWLSSKSFHITQREALLRSQGNHESTIDLAEIA